jgi:hypothetical protein
MSKPGKDVIERMREQQEFSVAKIVSARKPVSLAQFSFNQKPSSESEREQAEQRAIDRIKQAVEMLDYSLTELAATPNQSSGFANRVNQQAVIAVLRTLCKCVVPPIMLDRFREPSKPGRVSMDAASLPACAWCDGPARIQFKSEWYCEGCCPDESPHKTSRLRGAQEREHRARLRKMEHEAFKLKKAIRRTQKAVQHVEGSGLGHVKGHGRHSREDAAHLEAGGRKENLVVGSTSAHLAGADGSGDAES